MVLRNLVRTIIVSILCLVCLSCITIRDEYPPEWPSLSRIEPDCSKIAGLYKDRGARLEGLTAKFFGDTGKVRDYVKVSYSPNSVEVDSIAKSEPNWVKQFTTEDGNFRCVNGRVELSFSRGCSVCPGATYEKLKLNLVKADDGSLIVQTEGGGAYLVFFIVPAGSTLSTWDRYFPQ